MTKFFRNIFTSSYYADQTVTIFWIGENLINQIGSIFWVADNNSPFSTDFLQHKTFAEEFQNYSHD